MIDVTAPHGTDAGEAPHGRGLRGRGGSRRVRGAAGFVVLCLLFAALYSQARSVAMTSDGAGNALQAWDMLHGNVLLHHWVVSDVSFYTTELPEYMIVESVAGLGPDTVAIAAALTFTLIIALGVVAAVGGSTGRERWIRGGIAAAAIMAPSIGGVTTIMLSSPDHIGTAVPVLVAFIVLDRWGGRRWTPWALTAILVWSILGDPLVEVAGALPIAVVAAVRALKDPVGRRAEAWTALGAVASVPLSVEAAKALRALGGFVLHPPPLAFIDVNDLPAHFSTTLKSILDVGSADFSGLTPAGHGAALASAGYHLVFVVAAVSAVRHVLRRFAIADPRLDQVLAVALCAVALAFMLTSESNGADPYTPHEIAVAMPLGAVLLARVAAAPAMAFLAANFAERTARRLAAAAVAGLLAASSFLLALHSTVPAKVSPSTTAVAWLDEHGLTSGIGGYWQANIVTALSHGRIVSRPVDADGTSTYIERRLWETNVDWYSADRYSANFMIVDTTPGNEYYGTVGEAVTTFGKPVERAVFPGFTILVWDHDILAQLRLHDGRTEATT